MNDKEIFKAVEDRIFKKTKTKKYETEPPKRKAITKRKLSFLL